MPTGYTAAIKDGIEFKEYALNCARAFGALVMMRDEPSDTPIPEKQEVSTYHLDALNKAKSDLQTYLNYTSSDWKLKQDAQHVKDLEYYAKRKSEEIELLGKYTAMLAKAKSWVPPTTEHVGLKGFMVKQLEDSISWDCNYYTKDKKAPVKIPLADFISQTMTVINNDIAYHTTGYKKDVAMNDDRNKWVDDLRQSLNI